MVKCCRRNCTSHKPGIWEPIVLLWPEGRDPRVWQPASINVLGKVVCDDCKPIVTIRDCIPDEKSWLKIKYIFDAHSKVKPSLETAKVTFVVPDSRFIKDVVLV